MKKETKTYIPSIRKFGEHYDLRCLDRNCKANVKYLLTTDKFVINNRCSINEFKDHNYAKKNLLLKKQKKKM